MDKSAVVLFWLIQWGFFGTVTYVSSWGLPKADRESGDKIKSTPLIKALQVARIAPVLVPTLYLGIMIPVSGFHIPKSIQSYRFASETSPVFQWLGLTILYAAWMFHAWSFHTIASGGALGPFEARTRHRLVKNGPFGIVRHPIYSAGIFASIGTILATWNSIFLWQFALLTLLYIPFIPMEEGLLEMPSALGKEYTEYKRQVKYRLVPGLY